MVKYLTQQLFQNVINPVTSDNYLCNYVSILILSNKVIMEKGALDFDTAL